MRNAFIGICLFSFMVVGWVSCKKDNPVGINMGYNYFPTDVGRYVIYDVDSIYYDNANLNSHTHLAPADTFKFQLKEKIESIYSDNLNRPTVRLERYVKLHNDSIAYSQMPWTLRNVWAENRTASTAEKVEENMRYIKLAFPVKDNQTWNGNAQNNNQEMDYYYSYYDQSIKIRNIQFDSVLQVIQYDDGGNIITERQLYTERYARKVGLVSKESINIQSQPYAAWSNSVQYPYGSDSTTAFILKPIMQRITGGIHLIMWVNSYGVE